MWRTVGRTGMKSTRWSLFSLFSVCGSTFFFSVMLQRPSLFRIASFLYDMALVSMCFLLDERMFSMSMGSGRERMYIPTGLGVATDFDLKWLKLCMVWVLFFWQLLVFNGARGELKNVLGGVFSCVRDGDSSCFTRYSMESSLFVKEFDNSSLWWKESSSIRDRIVNVKI